MANENIFKQLQEANKKMPTITLQGKKYVQVKDRVVAFRSVFPKGKIITNYSLTDNYIYFEAIVSDENNNILATGHSRAMLNQVKCIEKCESNAVGRALALIGFGTSESIASYDEMQDFQDEQIFNDEEMEKDKKRKAEAIEKFNKLSMEAKANILNLFHTKNVETIDTNTLCQLVRNAK